MRLIAGYARCYGQLNSKVPVSDLLFARSQMGMSLAFHIVFAAIGIGLPVLMVISEARYLRTSDPFFLELAKRRSRGAAILFAVGAVSGTVLSFELGLLWPRFVEKSGAIIGMPFSLEGFAFFTEAIFLGLYLMGWKRLPPLLHWFCGVPVILGGVTSGIFVVTANAWMNTPAGQRSQPRKMIAHRLIRFFSSCSPYRLSVHSSMPTTCIVEDLPSTIGNRGGCLQVVSAIRQDGHLR